MAPHLHRGDSNPMLAGAILEPSPCKAGAFRQILDTSLEVANGMGTANGRRRFSRRTPSTLPPRGSLSGVKGLRSRDGIDLFGAAKVVRGLLRRHRNGIDQ